MKTNFASTLAFIPVLTVVSAFEVAEIYKKTLGNSDCTNIHLTDGHVLRATCTDPATRSRHDYDLDLNNCFANYLGTLDHTPHGDFGPSCNSCHMSGTKLICECSAGAGRGTKHNEFELDNWWTVQINPDVMTCNMNTGIEKRSNGKEAQFFVA
ncbi:hypothetical protein F4677DRAFT_265039 [Hypoxylon crocopeplum]|nr:hypothetical protein F4677DRAFT_265039 [Hypoxylon crocopeplum]